MSLDDPQERINALLKQNKELEAKIAILKAEKDGLQASYTDLLTEVRGSTRLSRHATDPTRPVGSWSRTQSGTGDNTGQAGSSSSNINHPDIEPMFITGRSKDGSGSGSGRRGSMKRMGTGLGGRKASSQASPASEVPPPPPKITSPTVSVKGKEAATGPKPTRIPKKARDDDMVVPPINVLIVEDNPINQNILSMFLKKKKIKHQTAKDGEEAVRKWRTGGFHLILMDIQLPVKDGIEATREIRDLERNSNIGVFPMTPASEAPRQLVAPLSTTTGPLIHLKSSVIIVALTASSLQTDRVSALAAGCNDFLTKPVSLKWLEQKIIEWGCMQALIDFDGWRRWKSADPKESANETRRAFQTGPQAAAKSLAGRLKINPERRSLRQSSISSTTSTIVPDSTPVPSLSPSRATSISIPNQDHHEPIHISPEEEKQIAGDELEKARKRLSATSTVEDPVELTPGEGFGFGATEPEIESSEGGGGGWSPASLAKGLAAVGLGGAVASEEPELGSIQEAPMKSPGVEKPLPAIPPE